MESSKYNIFLSSANRLKPDRNIVKKIVDEINDNMGQYLVKRLALYRWESETRPKMGRPQQIIFEQSEYSDIDVYIGLIGSYLGKGTKEEFDVAYKAYISTGKPEIMMFQDMSPIKSEEIDLEQIRKAKDFLDGFNEGGEHPGLLIPYKSKRELEQRVRKTLTDYVLRKNYSEIHKETSTVVSFDTRLSASGITNFYVGRDEWQLYRQPPRLADYLMTATESVKIATYWLAQGSIEGVLRTYKKLINKGVFIEVVTIDPTDSIVNTLSPDVNETPDTIKMYVRLALNKLIDLRKSLPLEKQELLSIRTSKVIPQAAVIFIDGKTHNGRIQLEFRPYCMPRNDSFSLEISYKEDGRLYNVLEESWNKFFDDAKIYE